MRDSVYAEFSKKYSVEERTAILALNRLDSKSKWNADTLVVPVKNRYHADGLFTVSNATGCVKRSEKFVIFSYPIQAFYGIL